MGKSAYRTVEKPGIDPNTTLRFGFVGAGNVAHHLANYFYEYGHRIEAVAARSWDSAAALAHRVGAEPLESVEDMPTDLDFIIIATSDSAVPEVAEKLPASNAVVVHTSGSVPLEALSGRHRRAAVLYPFQTFSKDIWVHLLYVPFFIEASNDDTYRSIKALAEQITSDIRYADSAARTRIHLAGVLTSNFPIYLMEMAREELAKANLPLSITRQLMEASIEKAYKASPLDALTGPARRGDTETIARQALSIENKADKAAYEALSEAILKRFGHLTTENHNVPETNGHWPNNQNTSTMIPYDLTKIRAVVFDIDGVLSPATIPLRDNGIPKRMANMKDGFAMVVAVKAGLRLVILSGASSPGVKERFERIGITDFFDGKMDKLPVLLEWMETNGFSAEEIAYVGDDVPDVPAMRAVGLPITPADGSRDAKEAAIYTTEAIGGHGVAREVLEQILRAQSKWLF